MKAQEFMDGWNCTNCGGVGYTYPGELPCLDCLNASKEYQRLRRAETIHNAPKTHETKKVVLVHHIDGKTETDAQWLARQAELDDYRQTVDGSSYRGQ